MRISNFKSVSERGAFRREARVDVTTGFLFWRQTQSLKIYKVAGNWFFYGSNEPTPKSKVEAAENRNYTRSGVMRLTPES